MDCADRSGCVSCAPAIHAAACIEHAARAVNNNNCGSRTAVGLLSLACPRESRQRERPPGAADTSCASRQRRGAPDGTIPVPQARARSQRAPYRALSAFGCDARRRLRGPKGKAHPFGRASCWHAVTAGLVWVFGSPYGANPSTAGLWDCAPKGSRAGCTRRPSATGRRVWPRGSQSLRSARVSLRHPGCPSLWLLSLGQARESNLPWVNHPEVSIYYSTDAPAGRSTTRW
jgi:hypothetical protein